jgi:hypothetical protein
MKKISTLIAAFISILFVATSYAQEPDLSAIVDQNEPEGEEFVTATFKGFRIINAQTNETAKKHNLHFNIAHRFGDIGGNGGGIHTLYGFDNSTDIRFSFDYGISDRLQAGVGRSKGNEPYTELYDGNIKFRLLRQTTDNKMPLSLTLYGIAGISGRRPSTDSTSDASFSSTSDRMSYTTQAIIARKFSQSISLELLPTWSHRNYVSFEDENDIFALGIGTRIKITKRFAFIADYFYNFSQYRP